MQHGARPYYTHTHRERERERERNRPHPSHLPHCYPLHTHAPPRPCSHRHKYLRRKMSCVTEGFCIRAGPIVTVRCRVRRTVHSASGTRTRAVPWRSLLPTQPSRPAASLVARRGVWLTSWWGLTQGAPRTFWTSQLSCSPPADASHYEPCHTHTVQCKTFQPSCSPAVHMCPCERCFRPEPCSGGASHFLDLPAKRPPCSAGLRQPRSGGAAA